MTKKACYVGIPAVGAAVLLVALYLPRRTRDERRGNVSIGRR